MAPENLSPPNRRRWLKWLAYSAAGLLGLVVVLYFVVTSSAFLKGFILPRVSRSLNAEISLADASISPFSSVVLQDLKLTPKGAAPLFSAAKVTARYNLRAILGGHIVVDEITIASPSLLIVENPDGTTTLSALGSTEPAKPAPPGPPAAAKPSSPSAPLSVDVKSIRLDDATIRYVKNFAGGGHETFDLSHVNLTTTNIKNGDSGKLDFSATVRVDQALGQPASNATLQTRISGAFTFSLGPDLQPGTVKGSITVTTDQATGDYRDFAAFGAKLDCDVTPMEIKQFALTFTKAGAAQGVLRVSGPFDARKMEGKLKVEVVDLNRQVLNFAGAASGLDFGTTTINTSNEIELAKGGTVITAAGTLDVARLQILQQNRHSPTLDLHGEYAIAIDQSNQTATLKTLNLAGTQNKRPLLQTALTSPMTINWGDKHTAGSDATLKLSLTDLNLADWQAFAGDTAPAGFADLSLTLLSQENGRQLTFDFASHLKQLTARVGDDKLKPLDVEFLIRGDAADLRRIHLVETRLKLEQQNQPLLTIVTTGFVDRVTQDLDVQVQIMAVLDQLAKLVPQTNVICSAGTLGFVSHIGRLKQTSTVTGNLILKDFTGRYGDYNFEHFGLALDAEVSLNDALVEIRKAAGKLSTGSFDVTGQYDLEHKAGRFAVKLANLQEDDLRPFLQPSLGEKKLVSVLLNTTASAGLEASGAATVNADLTLTNLVVQDPEEHAPPTPLALRLQVDLVSANHALAVHQCDLTLTPTSRADNVLRLTGNVDYARSNAITGNLKLAATALDLTAYYDLFAATNKSTEAASPVPASTPAPVTTNTATAAAQKEPDPIILPLHNFTFDLAIDRCYLRELDIAKLAATTQIDGGHVVLKPFQLSLNGAPINGTLDLDLGVTGYQYDVALTADKVQLAPLADSFSPMYRDKAKGLLTANIQLKGDGTTGRSLKKTLTGKTILVVTNADIEIAGPNVKAVLVPISLLLGAREILASPLDYIKADIRYGKGSIEILDFVARSDAFQATSEGTIKIADVLSDSPLTQPVDIALSRQLASRVHFTSTPIEGGYARLPTMVHLAGTLGDPTVKTVVGQTAETVGNALGHSAQEVKRGIGKIFGGGDESGKTNSGFHPLNLFKKSSD